MNHISRLRQLVKGTLLENEPMSKHTTFGIGGNVDCYIMPKTLEQLKEVAIEGTIEDEIRPIFS